MELLIHSMMYVFIIIAYFAVALLLGWLIGIVMNYLDGFRLMRGRIGDVITSIVIIGMVINVGALGAIAWHFMVMVGNIHIVS